MQLWTFTSACSTLRIDSLCHPLTPAHAIYKDQPDPTDIFKKRAKHILGELCMDPKVAVTTPNFRKLLSPEYHSDAGELTESEEQGITIQNT